MIGTIHPFRPRIKQLRILVFKLMPVLTPDRRYTYDRVSETGQVTNYGIATSHIATRSFATVGVMSGYMFTQTTCCSHLLCKHELQRNAFSSFA